MSDLDNEELKATKKLLEKIKDTPDDVIEKAIDNLKNKMGNEKSADEMFEELGYRKLNRNEIKREFEEIFKLVECCYEAPMCICVTFYKNKSFDIVSSKNMQELQAINKKCKELRMDIKKCKCGNIPEIREYYIKGVANRKNYFVKCGNCMYRTRSRNRKYKAIDEWNEYGAKLFYEERGLLWFDE